MRKRLPKNRVNLTREEIKNAELEANAQIQRRDARAARGNRLKELERVRRLLEDQTHPMWWVFAFSLMSYVATSDEESLYEAVQRIATEHADSIRQAFEVASAILFLPELDVLDGKQHARDGEPKALAMRRILLERGASANAAVRAVRGDDERLPSARLPEAETRAARREGRRIRNEALRKHAELVATHVPRGPILRKPVLENLKNGLLQLVDEVVRAAEKRQATIVKNIDRNRRRRT